MIRSCEVNNLKEGHLERWSPLRPEPKHLLLLSTFASMPHISDEPIPNN
jgi:hypothetical protein